MCRRKSGGIQPRVSKVTGEITSFRIYYTNSLGKRQFETCASREEADLRLAERMTATLRAVPVSAQQHQILFGELAAHVITEYKINARGSLAQAEARFRLHIIPVFGDRRASSITTDDIETYTARRQQDGAANATINRELEMIAKAFSKAMKAKKIHAAPNVPMLKEDNRREGFFTRDQVERLTAHLEDPLKSAVWFGFLTGWRLGEIKRLIVGNVFLDEQAIRIYRSKNGEGRVFPLTDELCELLAPLIHGRFPAERVFDGLGCFTKSWRTACHKAGLPVTVEPIRIRGKLQKRVKVIDSQHTFHDLRRSGARELSADGVPQHVIMDMMGHKTDSMFRRYNIVDKSVLDAARDAINEARRRRKDASHLG